jgi:Fe-S-cluster-containing dehydrogenase component
MGKALVIDVGRCIGCLSCVVACKDEFVNNDWTPYSKPQPEYGAFWIKVDAKERGTAPKVKVTYTPILCMHCDNAPCIKACPVKAITKRADGIVLIEPNRCNGCKPLDTGPLCMKACPYEVIYFNEQLGVAQKCTLCAHLLDDPNWRYGPRCYDACPIEAIIYGDENEPRIKELMSKAKVLHPEYNTQPRVYYLNLPQPFITGCVVDTDLKEVVVKAKVTAVDLYTSEKHETYTDEFGDFWLKDLKWDHRYLLEIEKEGYKKKTLGIYVTKHDLNLQIINLSK